ncbi:hypothetical protein KUTeg_004047 [Tegillarca granosa]|uniref:EF-hand domain-containing protein n=1 Tax=Tegillarca granosa TaxID=220873 RepID=A0ABQ9FS12_TEGGR|nr:hypothetical protein KUTeg_004047 [Tegillarca granosa]
MEGDVLEKLRTVFDVCDDQKEGYITTDHFKNLAKEHFGADSSEILDPEGKGKINFEDFCKGVQQILDIHSPSSPVPLKDPFNLKNSSIDFDSLLTGEISPVDGPSGSSTVTTFNEYDINTDEDGSGLLIDFSTPEPIRRNIPTTTLNGKTDLTDEDNFEDFGEIDDFESDVSSDHNHLFFLL